MRDAYYFSHDVNAHDDMKMRVMMSDYGVEGYGVFWIIIEAMRSEEDVSLPCNALTYKGLTATCHQSFDMEKYIADCVEIGLFITDGQIFWSNRLRKDVQRAQDIKQKRADAGQKGGSAKQNVTVASYNMGDAKQNQANAKQTQANAKQSQAKSTKIKDKEKDKGVTEEEEVACVRAREDAPDNKTDVTTSFSAIEPPDTADIDRSWAHVVAEYEANIGELRPYGHEIERLQSYYDDLSADVVCEAIKVAALSADKSPKQFLGVVLKKWADAGVKSLKDVSAREWTYDQRIAAAGSSVPQPRGRPGQQQGKPEDPYADLPVRWGTKASGGQK